MKMQEVKGRQEKTEIPVVIDQYIEQHEFVSTVASLTPLLI